MSDVKKKILSIDGGGIRGIIPGQIVSRIESDLLNGKKITEVVDYFAGTSTGGILASAYLVPKDPKKPASGPKYNAAEVVDLYFERGDDIFKLPVFRKIKTLFGLSDEKYSADGIEDALADYFEDVQLKQLLKPCIITSYDIRRRQPHFFINRESLPDSQNFLVRDVARATSAAPTYFEPAKIKNIKKTQSFPLVDGGVFVNNPALAAYVNVRTQFHTRQNPITAKDMAILSLGTGFSKKSYTYDDAKDWGAVQWIKPIIDLMMSGVSDTVHDQLSSIYEAVGKENQYLRINTKLPQNVDAEMDCAELSNLEALKELGNELFDNQENQDAIKAWLEL